MTINEPIFLGFTTPAQDRQLLESIRKVREAQAVGPATARVYLHPNADGLHSFMVVARNQKEACAKIGCTVGHFRRMGGLRLKASDPCVTIALSAPERLWTKEIQLGPQPTCWLFGD